MPNSVAPGKDFARLPVPYQIEKHMTEIEQNKPIAEMQKQMKHENLQVSSGRDRQYRRQQEKKHMDRLLFWIQHVGYAPHIGYIPDGFDGQTLLHSGKYIKYPKRSGTQKYLKRKTSRTVRKYGKLSPKGNQYRKLVEYWWVLY